MSDLKQAWSDGFVAGNRAASGLPAPMNPYANTRPAPKLPEGYWTNESGTELWCKTRGQAHPYCLANELSSGIIMTRAIYPQDRKAIAAFLQGAR
jgi:hypothetical protein